MNENLKDKKDSSYLKSELSHPANSYFYTYTPSPSTLKKHGILKRLKNRNDFVIMKPDKGNGVVVMDRNMYNEAIYEVYYQMKQSLKNLMAT